MDKHFEKRLFEKFPKLFPNGSNVNPMENLMCFGFSHGNGWFNILDELFTKITDMLMDNKMEFIQVKEKFGSLRIYYDLYDCTEQFVKMLKVYVTEAEIKSMNVCEVCGDKGKIRNNTGWVSTTCDEHVLRGDIWSNE